MEILNRLTRLDQKLFFWFDRLARNFKLVIPARLISKTGDGYLQVLLPLLTWVYIGEEGKNFFFAVLAAFATERVVYFLLKNSLKRRRPPNAIPSYQAAIVASDEFSFPSGHTCAAFLLATMTAAFIPVLAAPMFLWASVVGLSRVMLGVHFPADIIAGATIGCLIGATFNFLI